MGEVRDRGPHGVASGIVVEGRSSHVCELRAAYEGM